MGLFGKVWMISKMVMLATMLVAMSVAAGEKGAVTVNRQIGERMGFQCVSVKPVQWRTGNIAPAEWLKSFSEKVRTRMGATGLSLDAVGCGLSGKVLLHDVAQSVTTNGSEQVVATFVEISYQAVDRLSGRIKAKGAMSLDALAFSAENEPTFIAQTSDTAAEIIVEDLATQLLPPEVVSRNEKGVLMVKGRKGALRAGEFLTVFARGESVKDKDGKVLDWNEDAVGTVQILRVDESHSEAQVVDGDAAKMVKGSRLRRVGALR